ncbi:MAG TPA: universal stress protein [Solirubrobacteraceae bacterium]|jgi:nucleotide-binding universal stress UspA family protein
MFKKIMCATDGSPDAGRALYLAGTLAADAGAAVDVVHVTEYFPAGRAAGLTTRVDEADIRSRIDEQVAASGVKCVTHRPHAAAGKTARRIADLAAELGSHVIVVGTRGHSAIAGAMLGSVTQRLLHEASCPVLAVPPIRETAPVTGEAQSISVAG